MESQEIKAIKDEESQHMTVPEDNKPREMTVTEDNKPREMTVTEDNKPREMTVTEDNKPQEMTVTEENSPWEMTVTEENSPWEMIAENDGKPYKMEVTEDKEPQEMTASGNEELQEMTAAGDEEPQEMTASGNGEPHEMTVAGDEEPQEIKSVVNKESEKMETENDTEPQEKEAGKDNETEAEGDKRFQEVPIADKKKAAKDKKSQEMIPAMNDDFWEVLEVEEQEPLQEMPITESEEHHKMAVAKDVEIQKIALVVDEEPKEMTVEKDEKPKEMTVAEDEKPEEMTVEKDEEPKEMTVAENETSRDASKDKSRTTIFFWDPKIDISHLITLLLQCPVFGPPSLLHCNATEWRSRVKESCGLFVCLSPGAPHPDLSDKEEFLQYCKENQNPEKVKVVLMGAEDVHSERKIRDWWTDAGYSDYELLTLSNAELQEYIDHNINLLSAERSMANKARHMHRILQEAAEKSRIHKWQFVRKVAPLSKHFELGIPSRPNSEYSWIEELLLSDDFKDHFFESRNHNVSKNRKLSLESCSFGMLYYTNRKGHTSDIDATDIELIQEHSSVGIDNMIIVIDGVEDSSDHHKSQILGHHSIMKELRHNLFLISYLENSSKYQKLLSSLLRIKKQQLAKVATTKPVNDIPDSAGTNVGTVALSEDVHMNAEVGSAVHTKPSWMSSLLGMLLPRDVVGIFSRSTKQEYSWLEEFIKPKFTEVRCFYISNNGFHQFVEDVSQCRFGILYHSKNRGRINVTDVTDSLYDDELQYMSTMLEKRRVWVVIDDMDDISEGMRRRILHFQPKIQNLAKDLYLIKHGTSEKKLKDLEDKTHLFT